MRASILSTLVLYWGGYSATKCTPYCLILDYTYLLLSTSKVNVYVHAYLTVYLHFKFDTWTWTWKRHVLQYAMWPVNPGFSQSWCSGCRHQSLFVTQMSWLLFLQERSVRCLNPHRFKLGWRIFSSLFQSLYTASSLQPGNIGGKQNVSFVRLPAWIKIENKSTRDIVITIRHDSLSVFLGEQNHMSRKLPLTRSTWFDLYLNVSWKGTQISTEQIEQRSEECWLELWSNPKSRWGAEGPCRPTPCPLAQICAAQLRNTINTLNSVETQRHATLQRKNKVISSFCSVTTS